jgi:hypothetical protein
VTVDSGAPVLSYGDVPIRREVFLGEGAAGIAHALTFSRPATRLWWLARQRYFDVSVVPESAPSFGDGWYDEESDGKRVWRWMGHRGVIVIPPTIWRAMLHIRLDVPVDAFSESPVVTITVNGRVLERIAAPGGEIDLTDVLPLRREAPNELVIETDRVINPHRAGISADSRDLGLRLDLLELQLEVEPKRHPDLDPLPSLDAR